MQVVFRTDASLVMGTGHVMRCLTLANALRERGANVAFICREHEGHLCDLIEGRGFKVGRLPISVTAVDIGPPPDHASWLGASWQGDLEQTVAAIESGARSPDWLVVDHYAIDRRWESGIRGRVGRLMVIDDLAGREHDCDLLLDQNLGRNESDYAGLIKTSSRCLIGPRHALLRPEFAAFRQASLARRLESAPRKILVTMGGVDSANKTAEVLQALRHIKLRTEFAVDVVLGGLSPWREHIVEIARASPFPVRVLVNVDNMAQIMAGSDVSIRAAGSTSWECCCMGLPSVLFVLADNQRGAAEALAKEGAALLIRDARDLTTQLGSALEFLLYDTSFTREMIQRSSMVCDGLGVQRVLAAIDELSVERYENQEQ